MEETMKRSAMIVLVLTLGWLACPAAQASDKLSVTVYNSNLGVVSEVRDMEFDKGINRIAFRDVPSQIDAASVRFELVGKASDIAILEQNYAYDLVSPDELYRKYLDHDIELVDKEGRLFSGKLLAYSTGAVTLQNANGQVKVIRLENITEVNFPKLPEGLITRPTLFWLYKAATGGKHTCNVTYQTSGMNWEAEYVGLLNKDETRLNLSGWASITNNSGKTFTDARLKLIAGDIHRAVDPRFGRGMQKTLAMEADMAGAGFQEKAFFEYHMYTLPRTATVANREQKQVSLFEPASTSVKKQYLYRPDRNPENVAVTIMFTNSDKDGLGIPLPAGRVRLFKADDDGSVVLLGEDRIGHTPKDEEVNLQVGNAFDIIAEHKLTYRRNISKLVREDVYEIEIRNRKSEDVSVKVEKLLFGDWQVVESDLTYEKTDGNTLTFQVPVGASQTTSFRFVVRFTSR
jgi:hypothetical protein